MNYEALVRKISNFAFGFITNKGTQIYFYFIFRCKHLEDLKVLTFGIAMRNPANYLAACAVPFGIAMRNLGNYNAWSVVPNGIAMRKPVNYHAA